MEITGKHVCRDKQYVGTFRQFTDEPAVAYHPAIRGLYEREEEGEGR